MRFPWLLPALLGGEAATSTLNAVSGEGLSVCESKALIGKAIAYQQVNQQQFTGREQPHVGLHGSPLASPRAGAGAGAGAIHIDCNGPTVIQRVRRVTNVVKSTEQLTPAQNQNQTELKLSHIPSPPDHDDKLEGYSYSGNDSSQRPESEPPSQDYDPGPEAEAEMDVEASAETKNPASVNRAIAGMGAGLLSVMLIMVFL